MKQTVIRHCMIICSATALGFGLLLSGYYYSLYVAWDYDSNFLQADSCLDNGGVWQSDIARCWYAGQCEDEGGVWSAIDARCVFVP